MPKPIRHIRIEGNIAYVPLTKGYEATIDAADVPLVDGRNWTARLKIKANGGFGNVYAVRATYNGGKQSIVWMHRLIANTEIGMETDHIDGNGLNNKRDNLRSATGAQNNRNRRVTIRNTSGAKGVHWHKPRQKWLAQIRFDGEHHHLGLFRCRTAAAMAYAIASQKLHGEFGRVS